MLQLQKQQRPHSYLFGGSLSEGQKFPVDTVLPTAKGCYSLPKLNKKVSEVDLDLTFVKGTLSQLGQNLKDQDLTSILGHPIRNERSALKYDATKQLLMSALEAIGMKHSHRSDLGNQNCWAQKELKQDIPKYCSSFQLDAELNGKLLATAREAILSEESCPLEWEVIIKFLERRLKDKDDRREDSEMILQGVSSGNYRIAAACLYLLRKSIQKHGCSEDAYNNIKDAIAKLVQKEGRSTLDRQVLGRLFLLLAECYEADGTKAYELIAFSEKHISCREAHYAIFELFEKFIEGERRNNDSRSRQSIFDLLGRIAVSQLAIENGWNPNFSFKLLLSIDFDPSENIKVFEKLAFNRDEGVGIRALELLHRLAQRGHSISRTIPAFWNGMVYEDYEAVVRKLKPLREIVERQEPAKVLELAKRRINDPNRRDLYLAGLESLVEHDDEFVPLIMAIAKGGIVAGIDTIDSDSSIRDGCFALLCKVIARGKWQKEIIAIASEFLQAKTTRKPLFEYNLVEFKTANLHFFAFNLLAKICKLDSEVSGLTVAVPDEVMHFLGKEIHNKGWKIRKLCFELLEKIADQRNSEENASAIAVIADTGMNSEHPDVKVGSLRLFLKIYPKYDVVSAVINAVIKGAADSDKRVVHFSNKLREALALQGVQMPLGLQS